MFPWTWKLKAQLLIFSKCLSSVKVLVAQLCPTLCDPMDCSPPGSPVHVISQARILAWVSISFSQGSSRPRNWTRSVALQADSLPSEPPLSLPSVHPGWGPIAAQSILFSHPTSSRIRLEWFPSSTTDVLTLTLCPLSSHWGRVGGHAQGQGRGEGPADPQGKFAFLWDKNLLCFFLTNSDMKMWHCTL